MSKILVIICIFLITISGACNTDCYESNGVQVEKEKKSDLEQLKNIDVDVPLESLVVISGVSGSGKSTLMKEILTNEIQIQLGMGGKKGDYDSVEFPKPHNGLSGIQN